MNLLVILHDDQTPAPGRPTVILDPFAASGADAPVRVAFPGVVQELHDALTSRP